MCLKMYLKKRTVHTKSCFDIQTGYFQTRSDFIIRNAIKLVGTPIQKLRNRILFSIKNKELTDNAVSFSILNKMSGYSSQIKVIMR